jgi:hypothetical protein
MSAICILTPIVIAGWPAFSAAVVAAAGSLGYQVATEVGPRAVTAKTTGDSSVSLEIARSEVVTDALGRDQRISVSRDGVTVVFSRDARGKASLCVTGQNQDPEVLRALGEELSGAVVQQYVYQKLLSEMQARGFVLTEELVEEDRSIHLKVRHWEN